jgi:hypothetical protein
MNVKMKTLSAVVFPSTEDTIMVADDPIYGGGHYYQIQNCKGFNNGKTEYDDSFQSIEFIHKADDGSMTPGLQSEQLVLMLLDRHIKLNDRFPSPENDKMIEGLQMFIVACEKRVNDRISRGVMGELKK